MGSVYGHCPSPHGGLHAGQMLNANILIGSMGGFGLLVMELVSNKDNSGSLRPC